MIFKNTLASLKAGDKIEIISKLRDKPFYYTIGFINIKRKNKDKKSYINICFNYIDNNGFVCGIISKDFKFYSDLALLDRFIWKKNFIIKLI